MKWLNQFLNYIIFFVTTVCIVIFGYVYLQKTEKIESKNKINSLAVQISTDDIVNKYMKETQIDLQKQQRDSVYKIKSTQVSIQPNKNPTKEISPAEIPIERQIVKNISAVDNRQTLDEGFNQKSYDLQVSNIQDEQAKKNYAKEFIANARKNGYHITLSEDMQVTSVTPIRKPTNQPDDNDTFEAEPAN